MNLENAALLALPAQGLFRAPCLRAKVRRKEARPPEGAAYSPGFPFSLRALAVLTREDLVPATLAATHFEFKLSDPGLNQSDVDSSKSKRIDRLSSSATRRRDHVRRLSIWGRHCGHGTTARTHQHHNHSPSGHERGQRSDGELDGRRQPKHGHSPIPGPRSDGCSVGILITADRASFNGHSSLHPLLADDFRNVHALPCWYGRGQFSVRPSLLRLSVSCRAAARSGLTPSTTAVSAEIPPEDAKQDRRRRWERHKGASVTAALIGSQQKPRAYQRNFGILANGGKLVRPRHVIGNPDAQKDLDGTQMRGRPSLGMLLV